MCSRGKIKHVVVMYIDYVCDRKQQQSIQRYTEIQFTTRPSEEP